MKLADVFSSNMVLQQNKDIYVFGTGDGCGSVSFLGEEVSFCAEGGKWEVKLSPHPAGGPFTMTGMLNGEPFCLENVMIGEVWLAAGQSNMTFTLELSENYKPYAVANDRIRYYTVGNTIDCAPNIPWQVCDAENCCRFSAIGHYFAHYLQKHVDVAVGVISCNVGASCIQAWTDKAVLQNTWLDLPDEIRMMDYTVYPLSNRTGCLYDNMLLQIVPYALRGVLWYQGESNIGVPYLSGENIGRHETDYYGALFRLMVDNWHTVWHDPDFPFLTVELAPVFTGREEDEHWACIREQQALACEAVSNVSMITIGDVGDPNNIHPAKKRQVGERLALAAMDTVYAIPAEYSGPVFRRMLAHGKELILEFDHADGGLVADGELVDLWIRDQEGVYSPAEYRLNGSCLVVWNDAIKQPSGAKYCFRSSPEIRLFNKERFPAAPFRTNRKPFLFAPTEIK